jgi:hypothetical protein
MDPFLKVTKHCYSWDKISELYDFGRRRKTTLDLKYQRLKIARGEKQGRRMREKGYMNLKK